MEFNIDLPFELGFWVEPNTGDMDLALEWGFSLDPNTGDTDPGREWGFWLVPKTGDTDTAWGFRMVGENWQYLMTFHMPRGSVVH